METGLLEATLSPGHPVRTQIIKATDLDGESGEASLGKTCGGNPAGRSHDRASIK